MNRRQFVLAGAAALVPVSASAASLAAPASGGKAVWHPDQTYDCDNPVHGAVLEAAAVAGEFPREQWESLRKWIGHVVTRPARSGDILVTWPTGVTTPYPTDGLTLCRLRTLQEARLWLRAAERQYLPAAHYMTTYSTVLKYERVAPGENGYPAVRIEMRLHHDLYLAGTV